MAAFECNNIRTHGLLLTMLAQRITLGGVSILMEEGCLTATDTDGQNLAASVAEGDHLINAILMVGSLHINLHVFDVIKVRDLHITHLSRSLVLPGAVAGRKLWLPFCFSFYRPTLYFSLYLSVV